MKKFTTKDLAVGGMIAALYVVLTWVANLAGMASGAIQVRLSEALTILPIFTVAAVPGLTVGCVLANIFFGLGPWDVVLGSFATLLGAVGTRLLRNKPGVAWLPPVISNMLIVPAVLLLYHLPDISLTLPISQTEIQASGYFPLMLTVGIGEIISCGVLGMMLYGSLKEQRQLFS